MNKLIKNELSKVFSKKAIYVMIIIILSFVIFNEVLNKIIVNTIIPNISDDFYYSAKSLNELDKNDFEQVEDYYIAKTDLMLNEYLKKYDNKSWQYYIIQTKGWNIINNMVRNEDKELYNKYKTELDDFNKKINDGNWKVFAEEDLKEIEEQIKLEKEIYGSSENENIYSLEIQKQVEQWRISKNISYEDNELKNALETWSAEKMLLRNLENKEKTKKLEYSEIITKQELTASTTLCENAINNGIKNNEKISYINGHNTITTENNKSLIESSFTYKFFIIIGTIIIAGTIISEEFNKGTIKLLLVRPYTRSKILFAKIVTCIVVIGVMYLTVNISQFLIGGIFNGFNNYSNNVTIYNFDTNAIENISTFKYLLLIDLSLVPMFIITMMFALMLGALFTNSAIAIALPLLTIFASDIINSLIVFSDKLKFLKFFISPNWDLSIFLFGKLPQFESISLGFSSIICLIYFVILTLITFVLFKKKEIKNI